MKTRFSKTQMKRLLAAVKIIVYSCSKYTPPDIKSSELNYCVAKCILSIDELLKQISHEK